MYIIVGLGNPTRQYEGTKHNVGFDTIDYLIDEYQIPSSGAGHKALFGKGMIAGQKVIVAKPMTYMNLSGESVRELVNYYKVDPESELIVVYDDISLAPGQIRIRKKGSAGGHNGIKNIIANLGTDRFMRVKVGVGEKPKNWDLDRLIRNYLKQELLFTDQEIRNNIDLFRDAQKKLDLMLELSTLKGKSRDKKNPKGYIINALKGKVKDKEEL